MTEASAILTALDGFTERANPSAKERQLDTAREQLTAYRDLLARLVARFGDRRWLETCYAYDALRTRQLGGDG